MGAPLNTIQGDPVNRIHALLSEARRSPSYASWTAALELCCKYVATDAGHPLCARNGGHSKDAAVFGIASFSPPLANVVPHASAYKDKLDNVIRHCPHCVYHWQEAKGSFAAYLGSMSLSHAEQILQAPLSVLVDAIQAWELSRYRADSNPKSSPFYEALCSPLVLVCHPEMPQRLSAALDHYKEGEKKKLSDFLGACGFPNRIIPGLMLLSTSDAKYVASWASAQWKSQKQQLVEHVYYSLSFDAILASIRSALAHKDSVDVDPPSSSYFRRLVSAHDSWPRIYAASWDQMAWILEQMPHPLLARVNNDEKLFRFLVSNLDDHTQPLGSLLLCVDALLHPLGYAVWGGDVKFASMIVNHVMGRQRDLEQFVEKRGISALRWLRHLYEALDETGRDARQRAVILDVKRGVTADVLVLLFKILQHSHIPEPVQMAAREMGMRLLTYLLFYEKGGDGGGASRPIAPSSHINNSYLVEIVNVHDDFIVRSAFVDFVQSAIDFVRNLLMHDAKSLAAHTFTIAHIAARDAAAQKNNARLDAAAQKNRGTSSFAVSSAAPRDANYPPPFALRHAFWQKTYSLLTSDSAIPVSILFEACAPCIPLTDITETTINEKNRRELKKVISSGWTAAPKGHVLAVVHALEQMRDPLAPAIREVAEGRDAAKTFKSAPVAAWCILLSPDSRIHDALLMLGMSAFDVYSRRDVIRMLIETYPKASAKGITLASREFVNAVENLPDATQAAERMAGTLLDIIQVLCDPASGLLPTMDDSFKASIHRFLEPLWDDMCRTFAKIIKFTPQWARYHPRAMLTVWMRDLVMFGKDLVSHGEEVLWPAIHQNSARQQLLVKELSDAFVEIVRWLRLDDKPLLAQVVTLVGMLTRAFCAHRIEAPPDLLDNLKRLIQSFQPGSKSHRLSAGEQKRVRNMYRDLAVSKRGGRGLTAEGSFGEDDDFGASQRSVASAQFSSLFSAPKGANVTSRDLSAGTTAAARALPPPPPPPRLPVRARGEPWTRVSLSEAPPPPPEPPRPTAVRSPVPPPPSSETSDTSDEEDAQSTKNNLTGLLNKFKPSEQRRGTIMLQDAGTQTHTKRPAKAEAVSRAALSASEGQESVAMLHRRLLSWDIDSHRDLPPNATALVDLTQLCHFSSVKQYRQALLPSLYAECWAGLQQAKRELDVQLADNQGPALCRGTVVGRQSVDAFTDITFLVKRVDKSIQFTDMDLLVLWPGTTTLPSSDVRSQSRMAKIQHLQYKASEIVMTLRFSFENDPANMSSALSIRSEWRMAKLTSLSTTQREFTALMSVSNFDHVSTILSSKIERPVSLDERSVRTICDQYALNDPQARAVYRALNTDGVSLIQGPPGTGKTKTIVSLLAHAVDTDPQAKILVCAPSNAAVDEITRRLLDGIPLANGRVKRFGVVRIGAAADATVQEALLSNRVDKERQQGAGESGDTPGMRIASLKGELQELRQARDAKFREEDALGVNDAKAAQVRLEIKNLKAKIFQVSQQIDAQRDEEQRRQRANDIESLRVRNKVLSDANVICTTLSGSGHETMNDLPFQIDKVVIDEAAQAVELSSLIPLRLGSKQIIMVGDPLQLPPTVLNPLVQKAGYDRSLFVRLNDANPGAVQLLSIQYRMQSQISEFPSAQFYGGRLDNGPYVDAKTAQVWHHSSMFPPYAFINVASSVETKGQLSSYFNTAEANIALQMYNRLRRDFPDVDWTQRIGIVTPYKGQLLELRRIFRAQHGPSVFDDITFNTVDGFQGQEKDIIIISCVRGGTDSGIGFLADPRRLNVAITRARSSLYILGDARKLDRHPLWHSLISDASSRRLLYDASAMTYKNSASLSVNTEFGSVLDLTESERSANGKERQEGKRDLKDKENGKEQGKEKGKSVLGNKRPLPVGESSAKKEPSAEPIDLTATPRAPVKRKKASIFVPRSRTS